MSVLRLLFVMGAASGCAGPASRPDGVEGPSRASIPWPAGTSAGWIGETHYRWFGEHVAVADLDADGLDEAWILEGGSSRGNWSSGAVWAVRPERPGIVGADAHSIVVGHGGTARIDQFSIGDVEGDGDADLLLVVRGADQRGDALHVRSGPFGGRREATLAERVVSLPEGAWGAKPVQADADAASEWLLQRHDPASATTFLEVIDGPPPGRSSFEALRIASAAGFSLLDHGPAGLGDGDGDGVTDFFANAGSPEVVLVDAQLGALKARFAGVSHAAFVGDLDGDGVSDAAFMVPRDQEGARVHLVRGPFAGDVDVAAAAFATVTGGPQDWGLGEVAASAGDLDGDGLGDLVLADPTGPWYYCSSGPEPGPCPRENGVVWLLRGDGTVLRKLEGNDNARLGESVAAGDLDGDGLSDVVLGAPQEDEDVEEYRIAGAVYAVLGRDLPAD